MSSQQPGGVVLSQADSQEGLAQKGQQYGHDNVILTA